jgi:hypothetical protein
VSDKTYKKIEIVGTSKESVTAAIQSGIQKASKSLHHLDWFEVSEIRGRIENGQAAEFQVSMKIGFRLDD